MPNIFRGFYNRETLLFFSFLPEFELGSEGTQVLFWGPVGSGRLMIWKVSVLFLFMGGRDLIFDPEYLL
jgi:hypothetical protein